MSASAYWYKSPRHPLLHVDVADLTTVLVGPARERPGLGLVVHRASVPAVRKARCCTSGLLVVDPGVWSSWYATAEDPFPGQTQDTLLQPSLDELAGPYWAGGADIVLTPSGCVREGDWETLNAVIAAGGKTDREDVLTLVAVDAAMLDAPNENRFGAELVRAGRPVALVLAGHRQPYAHAGRLRALRRLQGDVPGLLVLATEPLVALDLAAMGATTAVGYRQGLRAPGLPDDRGGPLAAGYLPGLLLSRLWSVRSPNVYADWFAGTVSPDCVSCARPLDVFGTSKAEKDLILAHNVHELAGVSDELMRRDGTARMRAYLADSVVAALARHAELHPTAPGHEADPVLRRLGELNDPIGRRVLASGAFSQ